MMNPTRSSSDRRRRRVMWAGLAAGAAGIAAVLPACNIVGPLGYLAAGPEKTPALFQLPEDRPTVVFVDDRSSVLPNRSTRVRIAKTAERTLLDGDAAGESEIISSDGVLAVTQRERWGSQAGIAEVGEAVGAEVVVYATIKEFGLSPNGAEYAPFSVAWVKVVDAREKKRLWPSGQEEWHVLDIRLPMRLADAPENESERVAAEQQLAEYVGRSIAQLFVKHQSRVDNPRIGR